MAIPLLAAWTSLLIGAARPADLPRPGLVATYSDGARRVRLVLPTPNLALEPGDSVHPSLLPAFTAEWRGLLSVLQTGEYTFRSAARIVLDGAEVGGRAVRLEPGRHPLRLELRRPAGRAQMQLLWESSLFALEPVPSTLLLHEAADEPSESELAVEQGRTLAEELGCLRCHSAAGSLESPAGPRLADAGARMSSGWLYRWLSDPASVRSSSHMPALLDEAQARDVAAFLGSLGHAPPASGRSRPPAPGTVEKGRALYAAVGCATCHGAPELALDGLGSKWRSGDALAAYLKDPARVDASGRMPSLLLSDEEARQIAAFLLESRRPELEQAAPAGDPARGAAITRTAGCAACHDLGPAVPRPPPAPPLARLSLDRGCLARQPGPGLPRYRLAAVERAALARFLGAYRQPDRSPAPVYRFYRSLERLRCVACHASDVGGATGSPAEAAPPLFDTGGKLRTRWLSEVLLERKRAFPYLELRMPHYPATVVQPLVAGFARAAGVEEGDGSAAPATTAVERAHGVDRIGMSAPKGGMACIGCHDWGEFKSQGEHGPDLLGAARRLRYEWFARWMLEPTRILSGTTMPSYFRATPRAEALATIRALWGALALGDSMPLPDGLRRIGGVLGSEEKPVPDREAIVVRWDMPEATPAAIAVGLPGRVSYCFDAGECRLRYAWLGGFVDLSGTLHRKTDENRLTPTAALIGEIFYRDEEADLRIGEPQGRPARRFRGYRLREGYPEFHYEVGGVEVYERVVAAPENRGIVRQFHIPRVERAMWFFAGEAPGVELATSLGPLAGGRAPVPRGRDIRFEVTVVKAR